MPTDDLTQGNEGAEGAVDLNEGQQDGTQGTEPTDTQSGDPLDDIKDPVARAEAKKFRAIARRQDKADRPVVTLTQSPVPTDYVSKNDIARIATTQAKDLVSDEVRDNWDTLVGIPLAGFDAMDAKSIAKNMTERLAILKARTGTPAANPAADLATTQVRGTAGTVTPAQKPKDPPNLKIPRQPSDWYKKS